MKGLQNPDFIAQTKYIHSQSPQSDSVFVLLEVQASQLQCSTLITGIYYVDADIKLLKIQIVCLDQTTVFSVSSISIRITTEHNEKH